MALVSPEGFYFRIKKIMFDGDSNVSEVIFDLYPSETVRTSGAGQFDKVVEGKMTVSHDLVGIQYDAARGTRENILTSAYENIKAGDSPYALWTTV